MRSLAANAVRGSGGDLSDPRLPPAQVVSLVKSQRDEPRHAGDEGTHDRAAAPPARGLDRPALAARQVLPMTNSRNSLGDSYSTSPMTRPVARSSAAIERLVYEGLAKRYDRLK